MADVRLARSFSRCTLLTVFVLKCHQCAKHAMSAPDCFLTKCETGHLVAAFGFDSFFRFIAVDFCMRLGISRGV